MTGAHLSSYNSSESAADLADLRNVLGYAEWNILGVSYGSDLAQMLMRDHPEGIRSVVLDSTIPVTATIPGYWLNTRDGFHNLFQACRAETACDAVHPHLETTFTNLVNKLEAEPLTVTVSDPTTGEDLKVVLDGGALVDWLRDQSRANTAALPRVPDLIDQLADGRPEAVEAIAKDRARLAPPLGRGIPSVGSGLGFGVVCREQYPFATREDLIEAGRQAFPHYPASLQDEGVGTWAYANDDCGMVWKVSAAPAVVRQPPASSIPTLLISGSFDAVASLDWTKAVAASLSKARSSASLAAGTSTPSGLLSGRNRIVADPSAPDTSCVGALKPPSFTLRASP